MALFVFGDEIARLRFWLSLIVDIEKPKALPNLDYKIVVGDSLVSKIKIDGTEEIVEIDWDMKSSVGEADRYIKNIQNLLTEVVDKQSRFFNPNAKNKTELKREIRNLKIKLLINQLKFEKEKFKSKTASTQDIFDNRKNKEQLENELRITGFDNLVKKLEKLLQQPEKPFVHFDWKLDFPEILNPIIAGENPGFDIMIANPPYVGQKGNKDLFEQMKRNPNFEKKMDYWFFFLHASFYLTKQEGINCYITSNYWITANGGKKIRHRIVEDYQILEYINFNEVSIFAAGVHTNIFTLKKGKRINNKIKCTVYRNKYKSNILKNRHKELIFLSNQNEVFIKWTGYLHFLPETILSVINKILLGCKKLSDNESIGVAKKGIISGKRMTDGICNINQGIVTGKDRYIDNTNGINEGVFILNESEYNNMKLSQIEKNRIKKFYKNSDIFQYNLNKNSKHYFIYVNDINNENDFKKLTNLYSHFMQYKGLLLKRSINGVLQSAYNKGKWWALTTDRPNINFNTENILSPQRSQINTFGYSPGNWYAASDVFYISLNKKEFSIKSDFLKA